MKKKSIEYLIVMIVIVSIALCGCVEEETIAPMETPAVDTSPTSTLEQETVLPTPTPEVTVELPTPTPEITVELPTLEPGYEWYQNDEFRYRIAYPEDWYTASGKFDSEMYPLGYIDMYPQGFTSINHEEEPLSNFVKINVRVSPNQTFLRFWETGRFFAFDDEIPIGLEELKKQGRIIEYKDITVNGKDGIEVVFDPIVLYLGSEGLAPPSTTRYVFFTNDDLDYAIMTTTDDRLYSSKYKDIFEYVINSFTPL